MHVHYAMEEAALRRFHVSSLCSVIFAVLHLGFVQAATTPRTKDDEQEEEDEDAAEENNPIFNTLWPIMMMLIVAGIFIAVIFIFCKRFCPNACRRRSRSNTREETTVNTSNSYPRLQGNNYNDMEDIWTTGIQDSGMGVVSQMEPPPYCDKPPAYDELSISRLYSKGLINDGYDHPQGQGEPTGDTEQPSTSQVEPSPPPYSESDSDPTTTRPIVENVSDERTDVSCDQPSAPIACEDESPEID